MISCNQFPSNAENTKAENIGSYGQAKYEVLDGKQVITKITGEFCDN
jgi:hypothetical protein